MRERLNSSEFLELPGEKFRSNFVRSFPADAVSGGQREAKTDDPDDSNHKRPDVRQGGQGNPERGAQQERHSF